MANAIASLISGVREKVAPALAKVEASNAINAQPPQESSYFRQKLKNFCKENWLKIILLILLVGLTSGLGSCIGILSQTLHCMSAN